MDKKRIAVITSEESDFYIYLKDYAKAAGWAVFRIDPADIQNYDLTVYDCYCILGGVNELPYVLAASSRIVIEEERMKGKKVFVEYCLSIGNTYSGEPVTTRFSRLVYFGQEVQDILREGDILDSQCNNFTPSYFRGHTSRPILVYKKYINAHSRTELTDVEKNDHSKWGLWYYDDNTMVCGFRICNFIKARFSPIKRWRGLVAFIASWLTDTEIIEVPFDTCYRTKWTKDEICFDRDVVECLSNGISWFDRANILISNGKNGVYEGLHHDIDAKGNQKKATSVRADCSGEAAGAFFVDHLVTGNPLSLERADNLEDFCYNKMQIKEGIYKGMVRWTDVAWGVCYQDDVARVLIPTLLRSFCFRGTDKDTAHLEDVVSALWFLVKTTGTDGLRVGRTDLLYLSEQDMINYGNNKGNFPSAHYNAYYHAALLMAYKITGIERFKEVAVTGLTSLMTIYPDLFREQSETQEMTRLIMPLAWLYFVTKEDKHKEWLYRVCGDLKKLKSPAGSYYEWDTGYKANRSRTIDSECSLLTKNGDPVSDLLYSMNWLPLAFIQCYFITKDEMFLDLWKDITGFFIKSQIESDNLNINGAWARGFDLEMLEVYGVPHDMGWGPWAIESGWTVAEILMGIGQGIIADKLVPL